MRYLTILLFLLIFFVATPAFALVHCYFEVTCADGSDHTMMMLASPTGKGTCRDEDSLEGCELVCRDHGGIDPTTYAGAEDPCETGSIRRMNKDITPTGGDNQAHAQM